MFWSVQRMNEDRLSKQMNELVTKQGEENAEGQIEKNGSWVSKNVDEPCKPI